MSLLRSSAWAASAALLLTLSRFALGAILARRLTQAAFGQFAYGQWLVDLSFLLCSLGATGAVSRYAAQYRHDPGLLAHFLRRWQPFAVGLPFIAALGVLMGAHFSGLEVTPVAFSLLAVWTLTNGLWAMQTAALMGLQRFDLIFRANAIVAVIVLVGASFLPWAKSDPTQVFALMAVASVCGAAVGASTTYQSSTRKHLTERRPPWRAIRGYAINIWFSALVASLVWSRGELPVVKTMLGDIAVAHYAAALTIFGGAVQGVMLGVGGVAPHLTRLWGEGKKVEAIELSRFIMDLQLAICGMGSMFVVCFGTWVVSLAFTDAYLDAAMPLSILCLGLISFVVSSQSQLLQLETDARFNRNTILLGAFVLYGLSYALIPTIGLLGAALARAGAMIALGIITILFAVRHWGWRSISTVNICIVFSIISISILVEHLLVVASIWPRILMFLIALFLLVVGVRDAGGKTVVLAAYRFLTSRILGSAVPQGRVK